MEDKILEQRFIDIEINLANQEKMLEELNSVVIEQGKLIDILRKQNKILFEALKEDTVKPLSEETRPPHYWFFDLWVYIIIKYLFEGEKLWWEK